MAGFLPPVSSEGGVSSFDVCVCVCVVLRRPIAGAASGDATDSEEELAAFCPQVSVVSYFIHKH